MLRLLVLPAAVLALSAAPAFAQDAPEGAYQALWCGIAFGIVAPNMVIDQAEVDKAKAAGAAATEEQLAILAQADQTQRVIDGGPVLVEQATAAYKGAGFTDESFGKVRAELEPKVTEQITGSGDTAEFQFEDCIGLVPGGDAAPATPAM